MGGKNTWQDFSTFRPPGLPSSVRQDQDTECALIWTKQHRRVTAKQLTSLEREDPVTSIMAAIQQAVKWLYIGALISFTTCGYAPGNTASTEQECSTAFYRAEVKRVSVVSVYNTHNNSTCNIFLCAQTQTASDALQIWLCCSQSAKRIKTQPK